MNDDEWKTISMLLDKGWKGDFDDDTELTYKMLLSDYDGAQIVAALKVLLLTGTPFMPAVSEIVQAIRKDPSVPTFDEAMSVLYGRGGVLRARTKIGKGSWEAGEREDADEDARYERLNATHPLIRRFVRDQGMERLRKLDLDGEHGEIRRRDLHLAWDEQLLVGDERVVHELARGERRGVGGLHRFDQGALGRAPEPVLPDPAEPGV